MNTEIQELKELFAKSGIEVVEGDEVGLQRARKNSTKNRIPSPNLGDPERNRLIPMDGKGMGQTSDP